MRTFRRSFWKTYLVRDLKLAFLILIVIVLPIFYLMGFTPELYIFFGLFLGCILFPFFLFSFFYVKLTDNGLIVQNVICPLWRGEYFYKEIIKVHLVWPGYTAKYYIQIFTGNKKSWHYFIEDLVDPRDYQEIVDILRAKGIQVEVKGLDKWVK